jgi:hypothetical protein
LTFTNRKLTLPPTDRSHRAEFARP